MDIKEAYQNLSNYLSLYFPKLTIDDLEISDVKGYWRIKKLCGGKAGGCTNMIHTCLFNEGPVQHTISYQDSWKGRDGRIKSVYETWKTIKNHEQKG